MRSDPQSGPVPEDPEPDGSVPASARNALKWSFAVSLLVQVINTISGIELARGLGVEDRGGLAAAMLVPAIIGGLATLGLEESLTYHVARDPGRSGRLVGSGLVLCALQSLAFTAVSLVAVALATGGKSEAIVVGALVYTLYVPFNMFGVLFMGTLNGLHRYAWANAIRATVGLLVITVQTVLLVLDAFTIESLVIGYVSSYLVTAVLAGVLVRATRPGRLRADRATARELFGYGVRSHSSFAPATLNHRLDQLVISIFLSTTQLGLYVVAVTMTSMSALIGGSVAYAALPNIAHLPDGPQRALLARRLVGLTLLASLAVAAPVALFADDLLTLLFGPDYAEVATTCRILVLASVVLSTNRAIEAVLRGVGRPLTAGLAELVALGGTVVGLAVLLPLFDLVGAGLASLLAYLVACTWMTRSATRVLEIPAVRLFVPDADAVSAVRARIGRVVDRLRRARDRGPVGGA